MGITKGTNKEVKCPRCGKLAHASRKSPGWYYCHNPSCNTVVFDCTKEQANGRV